MKNKFPHNEFVMEFNYHLKIIGTLTITYDKKI